MCGIFIKREYDVVFYYPQHFNRGSQDENMYFSHLINACKQEGRSYTVFEEPDFSLNSNRNKNATPFDFIFVLIILLRRMFNSEMDARTKDVRIGVFLSKTFFRCMSFNNVVTISQSMVSIFRGINSNCIIFDVQHGIIHPNKKNYLIEKYPDKNIIYNKMQLLLSGDSYKQLMIENDYTKYFKNNSHVIGSYIIREDLKHDSFNRNILVSLQFTHDHSNAENILLLQNLEQVINSNDDETITFYLKDHPRFNFDVNLTDLLSLKNVKPAPIDIDDCFKLCSLQITAYSTLVFEAALKGIPTILVNPLSKYDYFNKYFSYPFSNEIIDFSDKLFYKKSSFMVQEWASSYYSDFDKETFIDLLK
ncbi:MAG: hypothetical protein CMD16_03770 [Flavobacteriales bacterium]|nr:hypothetical protein [Flavobacteriales bacterium]|tara:strand:- start:17412 stop:18500 length:1089 start_codon:yes stop_codon:yes gene_type:complete